VKSEFLNLGAVMGSKHKFQVLDDKPLQLGRVLGTYALGYLICAVAVLPLIIAIKSFPKPPNTWQTTLLVLSVVWPIFILGLIDHRHEKIYDQVEREREKESL
jgi:apolipoprotein N-acyltransferase